MRLTTQSEYIRILRFFSFTPRRFRWKTWPVDESVKIAGLGVIAKTHIAHAYVICSRWKAPLSDLWLKFCFLFVTPWAVPVLHVLASVYALKIVLLITFAIMYAFNSHLQFSLFLSIRRIWRSCETIGTWRADPPCVSYWEKRTYGE